MRRAPCLCQACLDQEHLHPGAPPVPLKVTVVHGRAYVHVATRHEETCAVCGRPIARKTPAGRHRDATGALHWCCPPCLARWVP